MDGSAMGKFVGTLVASEGSAAGSASPKESGIIRIRSKEYVRREEESILKAHL
jgi:hypothetical protein